MAYIGQVLKNPETGWRRYDDAINSDLITYEGAWEIRELSSAAYGKYHICGGKSKIRFSFVGSKLRIIGATYKLWPGTVNVEIDGVKYGSYTVGDPDSLEGNYSVLLYEKKDLQYATHNVVLHADGVSTLDALDFGEPGGLVAPIKVGDVLKEPELGWKRFDDTDINIKYTGPWSRASGYTYYYNQSLSYKSSEQGNENTKCEFTFSGTGIRVISQYGSNQTFYRGSIKITIDGSAETYTISPKVAGTQILAYEKLNLLSGNHTVVIEAQDNIIDAIDILGGALLTTVKVGDVLKEPEPGWKRFDDMDSNINYTGDWMVHQSSSGIYYNNSIHMKSYSMPGTYGIQFTFSGTGLRLIAVKSGTTSFKGKLTKVTIDGVDGGTFEMYDSSINVLYQCILFEKLNLAPGSHTVTISTDALYLDAIDILGGELVLQDVIKKPKVSLYEKESGKIFVDDFDIINPKWLMSPSKAFNNAVKKGFLRMNHSADKDVMLLIDKPQSDFAIQVIADYAPTKEGDEGGLLIYQNEKNKVEFLESYSANGSQSNKEWMAICKEDQWDFYTKTDTFFDYVDNDSLVEKRIGVVLKRGTAEGFVPIDINKIIMTKSNMLRLRQLYKNYKIVLKDSANNILSTNIVAAADTGIDILLPSLEFEGIIEIYDEENELLAKKQATFYGGDMYCMGSSLQIKMNNEELNTTDPTNLGYMVDNERIVKMTIVNDNIGAATNIKLSIQQYMEKVGYTWALISFDGNNYLNEIQIDSIAAQSTRDFWVKVVKETNLLAFKPIYFNIHLIHS
ncbi:hypothetical protein [Bacillus thuringiensis]|uniref:hypothetical protein n=1 Tax=Bacillus thuringiensis TaxID=1428 RepID=UPI0020D2650D|nr:hypothetical protein [Bacillus thuringiensis]